LHICKKLCYKASLSVETNNDYINTCINPEEEGNTNNINVYCENKFKILKSNKELIRICKSDMCNLCCIGMDRIKKKNYSTNNLMNCFSDCAYSIYLFIFILFLFYF